MWVSVLGKLAALIGYPPSTVAIEMVPQESWARPVAEVYNLIRGTNPAPGAWTTHAGTKLDIFDRRCIAGSGTSTPGEVLSIGKEGMVVAARGGAIRVIRVRPASGAKMPAADWAAGARVSPGDRLGE